MKFKLFGKDKSKVEKKSPKSKAAASQIAELDEKLNGWTDNLKQTGEKLQKRSENAGEAAESETTHPHGPIKELSLEAEGALENGDETSDEDLEDVNLIEVQGEGEGLPEAEPLPTPKPEGGDFGSDSFKKLFVNEEDDENPLANLIQSLPEVTINELEDDLREIKDIIKDWQRK